MAFKIAAGLKKLHDQNLCHFDLKEANVFTMNPYTPVIGDLGIIKTPRMAKAEGFWGGTPYYMGKLVANGKALAYENCSADIYALGVMFHNILYKRNSDYINTVHIKALRKRETD